jgi:methylmalonyl-CoA/ethylmalonyl-CoA epimerase
MITQINHIGIAVSSLDAQIAWYRDVLKLEFKGTQEIPDQKVRVAIFQVAGVKIELLEPTAPDSPIAKFIAKKGAGMHHLALQTDDILSEISRLKEHGQEMIDDSPRNGAHQSMIAFIHPKSSGKILTELCQI